MILVKGNRITFKTAALPRLKLLKLFQQDNRQGDYPLIAATPGSTLPSIASSNAPPPVEI